MRSFRSSSASQHRGPWCSSLSYSKRTLSSRIPTSARATNLPSPSKTSIWRSARGNPHSISLRWSRASGVLPAGAPDRHTSSARSSPSRRRRFVLRAASQAWPLDRMSRDGCISFLHRALSMRSHKASPSRRPEAAQWMTVRIGVVHGILRRLHVSPARSCPLKVSVPRNRPPALGATVTWGTAGTGPRPNRAAAVRCEATVPSGPARQAIIASCSQRAGAPATT